MSLNDVVSAERLHIGFFGLRNAGKSSVVNAVTGQELSLVSDVKGTTTDPVKKAMELLPLGPVVIIDTPGFDDEGELGLMRVNKTRQVLNKTDVAVLVMGKTNYFTVSSQVVVAETIIVGQVPETFLRLHAAGRQFKSGAHGVEIRFFIGPEPETFRALLDEHLFAACAGDAEFGCFLQKFGILVDGVKYDQLHIGFKQ